jgi:ABC-type transport system involved in Fe-S cluster assembly fused permease/ATPase subunit
LDSGTNFLADKTTISIARAVLKNPPIMILMSNFSIDTESEKFVQVV